MARKNSNDEGQAAPGPAVLNTDRHLWPPVSAADAPVETLHVTADGAIGVNIEGSVIVKPLRAWHALARGDADPETVRVLGELAKHASDLETAINAWQSLALDAAITLEGIATERVSMMMTEQRVAELARERNAQLANLAARFRELLNA